MEGRRERSSAGRVVRGPWRRGRAWAVERRGCSGGRRGGSDDCIELAREIRQGIHRGRKNEGEDEERVRGRALRRRWLKVTGERDEPFHRLRRSSTGLPVSPTCLQIQIHYERQENVYEGNEGCIATTKKIRKQNECPDNRRHIASSACSCFSIASSSISAVFLTAKTISKPHHGHEHTKNLPSGAFVAPGGRCTGARSAPLNISFSWSCSRSSNSFLSSS